jgi:Right handed beta helix region
VSYTLSGRLQTRLAVTVAPFVIACVLAAVLREWWPVALVGLMTVVGLGFDVLVLHRLFPYQPAWIALPVGLAELWATMIAVRAFGIDVETAAALALFAGSWLAAQIVGHAVLPVLRLTYGEDGGELGAGGTALAAAAPLALAGVLGVAWVAQPPVVRLAAGVHEGPLVLDRAQRLVGERGAVVRGGILVTADDVTIRDVAVIGGEIGIEVRDAKDVVLDDVRVAGATLDGISARRSSVAIRDCLVEVPRPTAQGIDISFAMQRPLSTVERCTVRGGLEGIVSHLAHVRIADNRVTGTALRAIAVTEMSMGTVERNEVRDARGVGIFCGDYSQCRIDRNDVGAVRADPGDRSRAGFAVVSHYGSIAHVSRTDGPAAAFVNATLERSK